MDICKVYQLMICSTVVYIHLRVVTTMIGMSAWWHSIFFRQWYCHLEGNSIVTYILAIPSYSHNVWSHPTRHTQLTSFSLPAVCISWLVWAAALPMNWRGGKCDAWVCAAYPPDSPYTSYTVLQIMNVKVWYTATSLVFLNCSILLHMETQSPLYNWSYLILILHAIVLLENTLHKETQSPLYHNWSVLSWSNSTPIGSHWPHWPQVVVHYV